MSETQTGAAHADPNAGAHAPGDDADFDVVIDDAAPAAPAPAARRERPAADRAADAYEGSRADKRIARLVGQRNAAQEELDRLRRENGELHRNALAQGQARLTSDEKRAQQEIDAAQRELRRAVTEQDEDAASRAQARVADLHTEIAGIRHTKAQVEHQAQQQPQQQPAPVSPAMRGWVDDNPWFNTDQAMTGVAIGFDREARARGLVPETPAYFAHINQRMRVAFPEHAFDDGEEVDIPQTPEPRARQAAPASASAAAPRRNTQPATAPTPGRRVIRLTADQRDAAKIAGVSDQQYAASLDRLTKSGGMS